MIVFSIRSGTNMVLISSSAVEQKYLVHFAKANHERGELVVFIVGCSQLVIHCMMC